MVPSARVVIWSALILAGLVGGSGALRTAIPAQAQARAAARYGVASEGSEVRYRVARAPGV